MKAIELLKSNPNTANVIRDWFFKKMMESFEESDKEASEHFTQTSVLEAITDERLAVFIDVQPRALFDVFDENNIYIEVKKAGEGWAWSVNNKIESVSNFTERKQAETHAITEAFITLEEKLVGLPALESNKMTPPDETTRV